MNYATRPISEFSVRELQDYAHDYVRWEVYLLVKAEREVRAVAEGFSSTPVDFAFEVFAIHLRTLLDFFYPRGRARPTHVLARHFFEVPDRWQPDPLSDLLREGWNKANKQVAHLTTDRADDPKSRHWDPRGMTADLKPTILKFAREADYLHESFEPMVRQYLDEIADTQPPGPEPPEPVF